MHNKSTNMIARIFLTFAFSIACTQAALAQTPGPVPADLIVSGGGLEWVYASPCEEGGCSNPSPTNQAGWRYATYAELTQNFPGCAAFTSKCASAYFDPSYSHCDMSNCESGLVCSEPGELCANGQPGPGHGETFYVRGDAVPTPVPGLSMLGVAVLALGLALLARRRITI